MRIQVDCRKTRSGDTEPRSFVLGKQRIWITRVLEHHADSTTRRFTVQTVDRRRFALRQDVASGEWQLASTLPAIAR